MSRVAPTPRDSVTDGNAALLNSIDDGPAPHNHGGIIEHGGALPHPLPKAAVAPFPIPIALRVWVSVTGSLPRDLDPCRADVYGRRNFCAGHTRLWQIPSAVSVPWTVYLPLEVATRVM